MDDIHLCGGNDNDHDHEHAVSVTEANPIHELETAVQDTLVLHLENLKIGNNFENPSNDGSTGTTNTTTTQYIPTGVESGEGGVYAVLPLLLDGSTSLEDKNTRSGLCNLDHEGLVAPTSKLSLDGSTSLEDKNTGSELCNLDHEGPVATCKLLQKCSTFPIAVKEEITLESQPESKYCKRSQSLPTQHKLVSALKGSREKEGVSPRKLSVSWAPDVYDPPPTSLSHYPKKKAQQVFKHVKKHGKGKQKGKNMRGGGSGPKDKKHNRKTGGRPDRCLDPFADSDRVISSTNKYSSLEILDFDDDININNPDSNCSSNFLGQGGGTMHCVC